MKLGAYTACLHDRPLAETLKILGELGLTSAEINSGGFLPAPHLPIDDLPASADAREDYLGHVRPQAGIALTGAELNGNPLDPDPAGAARSTRRTCSTAIEVAALLGVQARGHDVGHCRPGSPGGTAAGLERAALGQPVPRHPRLPVERRGGPVLEGHPGAGRAMPTSRSASRCTRTTSSSTRRPWNGWSTRSTPPTSAPRWTRATCSGRASTRSPPCSTSATWSTTPPPRTPASTRPHKRQRRPRRPVRPGRGPTATRVGLGGDNTLSQLAGEPVVGVRRGRPRPRRRVLECRSCARCSGRPRHGGQHRARGPGARPDRGPAVRRREPAQAAGRS